MTVRKDIDKESVTLVENIATNPMRWRRRAIGDSVGINDASRRATTETNKEAASVSSRGKRMRYVILRRLLISYESNNEH